MKRNQCQIAIGMVLLAASTTAGAITINLDYTQDGGFFTDSSRRVIMDAAASFFESRLTDDFDAITSGGVNQMTATYTNPATGATTSIDNFSIAADTITVFVGGRNLSGSTLGRGGPGSYGWSGSSAFGDTVERRGELEPVQGASATEFSLWGGSISFNTGSSWYFDSDLSSDEGFSGSDFYSVALHELGHVLGLGIADSWENLINSSNEFIGTSAVAANGGSVALEGNGAHWLNGTTSFVDGVSQEAAMDPSIFTGTRKHFTDLDLAALDDIGWDVAPVPLPPALLLFASGLLGIYGLGRRNC
ncbi:MAG: peptidase M10A and M12B matrixin and adamalysin [Gammaproteobacteria bacterium]|nr:peptidase M10A and M12B matrixin and adamalysin [Gammaproteobacteria bacterium]